MLNVTIDIRHHFQATAPLATDFLVWVFGCLLQGFLFMFCTVHDLIVITKTCLYNFDPLKPHFYIVKLGFTGVYIIFLISSQNIDCGYSLELPQ